MSGVTVRVRMADDGGGEARPRPSPAKRPPPSRTARLLALAYYIERLIDQGRVKDYAEVARLLGISRARVTQIVNLLGLSVRVQEAVLMGGLAVSERVVRANVRGVAWAGHGLDR